MRRLAAGSGPVALLGPLALLSLFLLPGSAPTGTSSASLRAGPTVDPAALALLDRAAWASEALAYRGTQFVSAWAPQGSTGTVVDVVHRPGHGTTVRTPATAASPAGRYFVSSQTSEPSMLGGLSMLGLLGAHYDLSTAAAAAVAGRAADVVVAMKPGARRPSARFWLDRATGLVLRREVYDEQGRVTRASAFVDVTVGDVADGSGVQDSDGGDDEAATAPHAWPDAIDPAALDRMRDRGWRCPDQLPPSLQLVDARRGGGDYGGIVHLSYSDGLASVSVFEQRGQLSTEHLEGYRATTVRGRPVYVRDGVPQRLVWSAHGTVFTVVADATPRTVGDVVAALPHATDDSGAWQRLGRGLDRVASWFNPFG